MKHSTGLCVWPDLANFDLANLSLINSDGTYFSLGSSDAKSEASLPSSKLLPIHYSLLHFYFRNWIISGYCFQAKSTSSTLLKEGAFNWPTILFSLPNSWGHRCAVGRSVFHIYISMLCILDKQGATFPSLMSLFLTSPVSRSRICCHDYFPLSITSPVLPIKY